MAGADFTFTKESRLVLNSLLVSRRHSAKGAPRVSFGSSLSLDPCGKAFMWLRHKGNFRAFLVVGFMGFLNSGEPSGEAPSVCFGALRCAIVHFWLRPSKTPFGRGYVQELVHGGLFVWVQLGSMVEASQEAFGVQRTSIGFSPISSFDARRFRPTPVQRGESAR